MQALRWSGCVFIVFGNHRAGGDPGHHEPVRDHAHGVRPQPNDEHVRPDRNAQEYLGRAGPRPNLRRRQRASGGVNAVTLSTRPATLSTVSRTSAPWRRARCCRAAAHCLSCSSSPPFAGDVHQHSADSLYRRGAAGRPEPARRVGDRRSERPVDRARGRSSEPTDHGAGIVGHGLRRGHARQRGANGCAKAGNDRPRGLFQGDRYGSQSGGLRDRETDLAGDDPVVRVCRPLPRQRFLAQGVHHRRIGTADRDFIDAPGKARWYKFAVTPGSASTSSSPDSRPTTTSRCSRTSARRSPASSLQRRRAHRTSSSSPPSTRRRRSARRRSRRRRSARRRSVRTRTARRPSPRRPSQPSIFSPSTFSPSTFSPSTFSPVDLLAIDVLAVDLQPVDVLAVARSRRRSSARPRSPRRSRPHRREASSRSPPPPGLSDESSVVNTWNRTGHFYVRVTGRGGAFNTSIPFTLNVTKGATTCAGVTDSR